LSFDMVPPSEKFVLCVTCKVSYPECHAFCEKIPL
jgi:hypothetical protein